MLYTLLACEVIAAALTSPVLSVRGVRIQGLSGISGISTLPSQEANETIRAASLPNNTNWLIAPLRHKTRIILNLPWVSEVAIKRRLTGEVSIDVTVRKPVYEVATSAGEYELDRNGFVIRPLRPEMQNRLFRIDVAGQIPIRLGSRVGAFGGAFGIDSAMSVYSKVLNQVRVRVAKIEVDQSGDMCLNMADGISIHFGQDDNFDAKVEVIHQIYEHEPNIAQRVSAIDVTIPSNLACIPRNPEPQQPRTVGVSIGANNYAPQHAADQAANRSSELKLQ